MDGKIRVLKRDGTIEPFLLAKLLDAIGSAFSASGEPQERNMATARGLTEAVHAYLEKTSPDQPVPSEHLGELVELVLAQTGHTAASMAARHHVEDRNRRRRWLRVAQRRRSDGCVVHRQWNKRQVVAYLRKEHGLEVTTARIIAGRVERLVLNCGLKVVTAGLIREIAVSELLAWGLLPAALAVRRSGRRRELKGVRNGTDQR